MNRVIGRLLLTGIFVLGSFVSFGAYAASATLGDNYAGAGYSGDISGRPGVFGVSHMDVNLVGTNLTVDITTDFAGLNGTKSGSFRRIYYGDLFLGKSWNPAGSASSSYNTDDFTTTGTTWNYGFSPDNRFAGQDGDGAYLGAEPSASAKGTGTLYDIGTASNYNDAFLLGNHTFGSDGRDNQISTLNTSALNNFFSTDSNWTNGASIGSRTAVPALSTADVQSVAAGATGDWWVTQDPDVVTPGIDPGVDTGDGIIHFQIDLSGTDLLDNLAIGQDALIALRWSMTCANDVIEAEFRVPAPAPVPLPPSFLLMLSGLVGLLLVRRRR